MLKWDKLCIRYVLNKHYDIFMMPWADLRNCHNNKIGAYAV